MKRGSANLIPGTGGRSRLDCPSLDCLISASHAYKSKNVLEAVYVVRFYRECVHPCVSRFCISTTQRMIGLLPNRTKRWRKWKRLDGFKNKVQLENMEPAVFQTFGLIPSYYSFIYLSIYVSFSYLSTILLFITPSQQ